MVAMFRKGARVWLGRVWHPFSIVVIVAGILVFLAHFRPWQGGLAEDWEWVVDWRGSLRALWPSMIGRPLLLVPYAIGYWLTDGGVVGQFIVLGTVAVLQFAAAFWALRPLLGNRMVRLVLAFLLAMHPWWSGGFILRFIPAQVATLWWIVWLGAAVRLLSGHTRRWTLLMVAAPLLGMLTYPSSTPVLVVSAAALAFLASEIPRGRRVLVASGTAVPVIVASLWTVVIAPRIQYTYEGDLLGNTFGLDRSLRSSLRQIAKTLLFEATPLVMAGVALGLAIIALLVTRKVGLRQGVVALAMIAVAPLTALVFFATNNGLSDPERTAIPVGLTLWLVAVGVVMTLGAFPRLSAVTAIAVAGVTFVGAGAHLLTWTQYSQLQLGLIRGIQPYRVQLPDSASVWVEDSSGLYGGLYTLYGPYLNHALQVNYGSGASFSICTTVGDLELAHPGDHHFWHTGTPPCAAMTAGGPTRTLGSVVVRGHTLNFIERLPTVTVTGRSGMLGGVETGNGSTWWWLGTDTAIFDVTKADGWTAFSTLQGRILSSECAGHSATVMVEAPTGTASETVDIGPSGVATFTLTLPAATETATLTVTDIKGGGCPLDGEPRPRTVALMNPEGLS